MEGKNKRNIVIWLLVIIIVLLLVAVGTLVYTVSTNGTKIMGDTNNNASENIQNNNDVNIKVNELTEARVIELAKRVLENGRGSSDSIIKVMCGYEIGKNGNQYKDEATGSLYNLSYVSYTKFKIEVLKNFSEKYFEELNNVKGRKIAIEKDGYVGVLEGTWSGTVHQVKDVKLDKKENDVYYYTVNTIIQSGAYPSDVSYAIGIKLIDGNYVIDSLVQK